MLRPIAKWFDSACGFSGIVRKLTQVLIHTRIEYYRYVGPRRELDPQTPSQFLTVAQTHTPNTQAHAEKVRFAGHSIEAKL